MRIELLLDCLRADEDKQKIHAAIPELSFSDARQLLNACFDPAEFLDHTPIVKSLLEHHPGLAWSVDPETVRSPLTHHSSPIRRSYLHEVAKHFPASFLPQIRTMIATACGNMREPMVDNQKMHNAQLIVHLVSRLCATDVANLFVQQAEKYYAHLMELEGAESFPCLEGWKEKDFLPLRIYAHMELLVYMASGFSKVPADKLTDSMSQLEKLIDQELKTYHMVCLIDRIKQAIQVEDNPEERKAGKNKEKQAKKAKKAKLNRSCSIMRNLIMHQIKKLLPGESVSLETGWTEHSIYVQFLRSEAGSWEIILHDRRESEDGAVLTRSLGLVERAEYLGNYVAYFLKNRFGLIQHDAEKFYDQLSNATGLFESSELSDRKLVVLPDQEVGNCVVASHDSVLANSLDSEMFASVQAQERKFSSDPLRHRACAGESLHESFSQITVTQATELQKNQSAFRRLCWKTALESPSEETYGRLTPGQTKRMLDCIMHRIEHNKANYKRLLAQWRTKDPEKKSECDELRDRMHLAERRYRDSVARLIHFRTLPIVAVFALLDGIEQIDCVTTSGFISAALRTGIDEYGNVLDSVYDRCYQHVKTYFDLVMWKGGSYCDQIMHDRSYDFFRSSNLYIDSHPSLLNESIPYVFVTEYHPEEIYHYAVVRMYARAWATHADRIKSALRCGLLSDRPSIVRAAITLIGANRWFDDLGEDLQALVRKQEREVGLRNESIPTPDTDISSYIDVEPGFFEFKQHSVVKELDAVPAAELATAVEQFFIRFLRWGKSSRVSYDMLEFVIKLANERGVIDSIKSCIQRSFFSEETYVNHTFSAFNITLGPFYNLQSCFKQLVCLVKEYFSQDTAYIKSFFKQAAKNGIKHEYTAAALVKLDPERALRLYYRLLESDSVSSGFLFSHLKHVIGSKDGPKTKRACHTGIFCQMAPPGEMSAVAQARLHRQVTRNGSKLLPVKRAKHDDSAEVLPLSPRCTSSSPS